MRLSDIKVVQCADPHINKTGLGRPSREKFLVCGAQWGATASHLRTGAGMHGMGFRTWSYCHARDIGTVAIMAEAASGLGTPIGEVSETQALGTAVSQRLSGLEGAARHGRREGRWPRLLLRCVKLEGLRRPCPTCAVFLLSMFSVCASAGPPPLATCVCICMCMHIPRPFAYTTPARASNLWIHISPPTIAPPSLSVLLFIFKSTIRRQSSIYRLVIAPLRH